jgi:hypothetical protein
VKIEQADVEGVYVEPSLRGDRPGVSRRLTRRWLIAGLLGLVVAVLVVRSWWLLDAPLFVDFELNVWQPARNVLDGREVYGTVALAEQVRTGVYPPSAFCRSCLLRG